MSENNAPQINPHVNPHDGNQVEPACLRMDSAGNWYLIPQALNHIFTSLQDGPRSKDYEFNMLFGLFKISYYHGNEHVKQIYINSPKGYIYDNLRADPKEIKGTHILTPIDNAEQKQTSEPTPNPFKYSAPGIHAADQYFPVEAVSDNDGHWYVVPMELVDEFHKALSDSTDGRLSQEKREAAEDILTNKFSDYLTGGDLNLTQLYMKVETLEQALERELNEDYPEENPAITYKDGKTFVFGDLMPVGPDVPGHSVDDEIAKDFCEAVGVLAGPFYGHAPVKSLNEIMKQDLTEDNPLNDHIPLNNTPAILGGSKQEKKSALDMVEEFHQAFDIPVYITPTLPTYNGAYEEICLLMEQLSHRFKKSSNNSRSFLRMKLMFEEFKEVCEAIQDGDYAKILQELNDLLYTVYGTFHEFGLGPVQKNGFAEVHRANMSKLGADGKPVLRADGKVLKGPNYTPPDLVGIIDKFNSLASIHPEWPAKSGKANKLHETFSTHPESYERAARAYDDPKDMMGNKECQQPYPDNYERQVTNEQPPADPNY